MGSKQTDKLIEKKFNELDEKGQLDSNNSLILYVRKSGYYKKLGMAGMVMGALFFWIGIKEDLGMIIPSLVFIFGGSFMLNKAKYGSRMYRLIDTFRVQLIDKGVRSVADFSTKTGSSHDEIFDELKELQEGGFFRSFVIDRKNKRFVENESWRNNPINQFREVAFACSGCGASNKVFVDKDDKVGTCEYCCASTNV